MFSKFNKVQKISKLNVLSFRQFFRIKPIITLNQSYLLHSMRPMFNSLSYTPSSNFCMSTKSKCFSKYLTFADFLIQSQKQQRKRSQMILISCYLLMIRRIRKFLKSFATFIKFHLSRTTSTKVHTMQQKFTINQKKTMQSKY